MPKPVKKKKRFIARSGPGGVGSTTFAVVHRSQRDPLAADPSAPQRVLRPIGEEGPFEDEDYELEALEARREEQRNFGVYFDDEYDYLQHLRAPGEEEVELHQIDRRSAVAGPVRRTARGSSMISAASNASAKLNLPSSVFESAFEEDVGLLNRAAPRSGPMVGLDQDVLEVMEMLDDAYEVEEVVHGKELAKVYSKEGQGDGEGEEEEIVQAEEGDLDDILADMVNGEEGDEDEEEDGNASDASSGGKFGNDDDDDRFPFDDDEAETGTRFTHYSMSSSVVPRSEQLATLDDRFERFFAEYEEENTGALDMDEIEGVRTEDSAAMKHIVGEFEREKKEDRQRPLIRIPEEEAEEEGQEDEEDGDETDLVEVKAPKEKWDCESIISTYSNLYHHPKLISEPSKKPPPIQISAKTGMPKDVLGKGLTKGALKRLDMENLERCNDSDEDLETVTLASRVSALSVRNKHETKGERKERQKAFKDLKRERREEKKATKLAFKEEKARQDKSAMNLRKSVPGQHLL